MANNRIQAGSGAAFLAADDQRRHNRRLYRAVVRLCHLPAIVARLLWRRLSACGWAGMNEIFRDPADAGRPTPRLVCPPVCQQAIFVLFLTFLQLLLAATPLPIGVCDQKRGIVPRHGTPHAYSQNQLATVSQGRLRGALACSPRSPSVKHDASFYCWSSPRPSLPR